MWIKYLLVVGIVNLVVLPYVSGVRIPLFMTPLKALPQRIAQTISFYSPPARDEFFSKVTAWDVWQATKLPLPEIKKSSVYGMILKANSLYNDSRLETGQLMAHNMCSSYCYTLNISDIEYYTHYSRLELTGKTNPPITLGELHEAVVETLEKHFCFNMSYIEQLVGQSSFNVTLAEWKQFVYHIAEYAIYCRADILAVESSEFAELVRTDEDTLRYYTLAQLDSKLIPSYLDIIKNKQVFEGDKIGNYLPGEQIGGGFVILDTWSTIPLYSYIYTETNFTIRDLEILYNWNSTQLYALQFIPLSSYTSCTVTGTISSDRTMYNISRLILENFNCPVALVLSSSVGHVQTISSEIRNPLELSVLSIFTAVTGIESWIDIADIFGLNYAHGLTIDTPRLREIVRDNNGMIVGDILNFSVHQIIANFISVELQYNSKRYEPKFNEILSAYGFSREELLEASGESVTDLTTITEIHRWLLKTVSSRYYVHNISGLIGYYEYFPHDLDLVVLPSSEWSRIIDAVIQQSFKQVMQAFRYDLETNPGSVYIRSQNDSFQTIIATVPSSFDNDDISNVSSCLFNKTIDFFQSSNFMDYHSFYNNTIAKTMNKMIMFETRSLESYLYEWSYDLEDIDDVSLLSSIKKATGFELFEIECLYDDSMSSLLRSGITWDDVGETKLCYSFVNLSLSAIVWAVEDTENVTCVNCLSSPCQANQDCMEDGSEFECHCKSGFSGDTSCTDINECGQQPPRCHTHATCKNSIGTFSCTCNPGFIGNGNSQCTDANECTSGSSPCHSDATCQNTIGSYTCSCKTGFTGDGKSQCTAVDPGSSNPSPSSNDNIGVIIGVAAAAMVVIVTVILVVAWCFYRRKPSGQKSRDIGNISNAAYVGDKQPNRRLPRVPAEYDDGYEEPSDYAQLDTFKRVPIDANYQSLTLKNKEGGDAGEYAELERENDNDQRYTSAGMNNKGEYDARNLAASYVTVMDGPRNEGPKESIYEELP